jgi:YesN/AraC family two-component response regulator
LQDLQESVNIIYADNLRNFIQHFKKVFDMIPGEYRNTIKN